MMYYSQFGEDRWLEAFFGQGYAGSCVEVGANDGVFGSTTLRFEELGWSCVLIEPNPDLCGKLRARRTGQVFEFGASDHEGTATLHIAEGADYADGVSSLGSTRSAEKRISSFGFRSRPVIVRINTLDFILEKAGLQPGIDFISIDVEGHEMNVLRGLNLSRWCPRILIIEDNTEFRDEAVAKYLLSQDYIPFKRSGVNDWFAKRDDASLITEENLLSYKELKVRAIRVRRRAIPREMLRSIARLTFVRALRKKLW